MIILEYLKINLSVFEFLIQRRHHPNFSFQNFWIEIDEGLTPTKDGGICLRRLSMFRKEVH